MFNVLLRPGPLGLGSVVAVVGAAAVPVGRVLRADLAEQRGLGVVPEQGVQEGNAVPGGALALGERKIILSN